MTNAPHADTMDLPPRRRGPGALELAIAEQPPARRGGGAAGASDRDGDAHSPDQHLSPLEGPGRAAAAGAAGAKRAAAAAAAAGALPAPKPSLSPIKRKGRGPTSPVRDQQEAAAPARESRGSSSLMAPLQAGLARTRSGDAVAAAAALAAGAAAGGGQARRMAPLHGKAPGS